jgi:formate dehydrogenase maturation protein FdhE
MSDAADLSFLAVLTLAQRDIQADLPPAALPPFERIGQALEHEMPPISRTLYDPDGPAMTPLERLHDRLAGIDLPPQTAAALDAVRRATRDEL